MKSVRLAGCILTCLAASPSYAGIVRVDFGGSVSGLFTTAQLPPITSFGSSIQIGTPFVGYMTFDDVIGATYQRPEAYDPTNEWLRRAAAVAEYELPSPASDFHTEVGLYTTDANVVTPDFPMGGTYVVVSDSELNPNPTLGSRVHVRAVVGEWPPYLSSEMVLTSVWLELIGNAPGLPLHSTSLSSVPWSLTAFPIANIEWHFADGYGWGGVTVVGTIDELSVTVPEAGAVRLWSLAALVCAALGFRHARG